MTTQESRPRAADTARFDVREVHDPRDFDTVIAIRRAIFTNEQHLTDVVDRDPYDRGPGAVQVLALVDRQPVGTGRLHVWRGEGQIAWVGVLPAYRGNGIGWAIMTALLDAAKRLRADRILLSAQTHALEFYRRLGFEPVGDTFVMSNIEHITMIHESSNTRR